MTPSDPFDGQENAGIFGLITTNNLISRAPDVHSILKPVKSEEDAIASAANASAARSG